MSQHSYGPPEGYQQPHPNSSLPYATYNAPSYPHPNTGFVPPGQNVTNQSFNYNRNVIPGLGLGFSSPSGSWQQQQPWSNPPPTQQLTESLPSGPMGQSEGIARLDVIPMAPALQTPQADPQGDAMDEGELSEGELEDIYEPEYPDQSYAYNTNGEPQYDPLHAYEAVASEQAGAYRAPKPEDSTSDREGSYSPYLSSNEMEQSDTRTDQELVDENSARPITDTASSTAISHPKAPTSPSYARQEARSSILRLWPLNVRYEDYLKEGIDPVVLQGLFSELGLALSSKTPTPAEARQTAPSSDIQTAPVQSTVPGAQDQQNPPPAPAKTTVESSASESRKDRIARLLAAKGSKQSAAASPEAGKKAAIPPPMSSTMSAKALSEKSKLLQRKMEALQKARDAQAGKSGQQTPQSQSDPGNGEPVTTIITTEIMLDQTTDQPAIPEQTTRSQSSPVLAPAAPALQQQSSASHLKRPTASELNLNSEASSKRPFGQSRQYQRFLIDVSDDDDDEAMDLDSPELRPASVNKPSSPFKVPAYQDLHTAPTGRSERQVSSPMATPPVKNGGKGDLESMNKKIEMMKLKIAEAEAKKKAKLSRPASPAVVQLSNIPKGGSPSLSVPLPSTEGSNVQGSPRPIVQPDDPGLPRIPKRGETRQREENRSRSRAASERLPVVEAHRREQLLKLQLLQSQVRRMEKEIEESLQEEERLRSEAIDETDSDEDRDEQMRSTSPESADGLVQEAPLQPETQEASPDVREVATTTLEETPAQDEVDSGEAISEDAEDSLVVPAETPRSTEALEQDIAGLVEMEATPPHTEDADELEDAPPAIPSEGESEDDADADEPDDYEPPEADPSPLGEVSDEDSETSSTNAEQRNENPSREGSDGALQTTEPITQPISTGQQESKPPSPREADRASTTSGSAQPETSFVPYETPLKYFRAYRFHPRYSDAVPGGLRSLTYSNNIDVKTPLCPDQLAGTICPRGEQCEFQHFEAMDIPDDQILLQLGDHGSYDGEQRQEYINGLRQLLTDFRNRKIKDFKAISQGIIDYRAQFRKDPSKILPLGDVSI